MSAALDRLLAIMARLRSPERGCPWDLEQDFATIAPYTLEEAYEVADAIARGDMPALKDELGDLLFQVVFHARMAEENGLFGFENVASAIADKMVRRHPHVFGDAEIDTAAAQTEAWEEHKANERAAQAATAGTPSSVLDGVALALPALARAAKIQRRAARIGFDWSQPRPVIDKLREEIAELETELDAGPAGPADQARVEDEVGDILFAAANLARKLDIDPEAALRAATAKFERRFRAVEALSVARGAGHDLDALEALWQQVKRHESNGKLLPAGFAVRAPSSPPTLPSAATRDGGAIRLERVAETPPTGFNALRNEARGEGYRMLDTLAAGWEAREIRFAQEGEALFAAYCDDHLVGVGGITRDPAIPEALRMRRFYVAKEYRRRGVARQLAFSLLHRKEVAGRPILVNAGAGSEAFWESLGFTADRQQGHTHMMQT
jgi:nucleoside triphosphate diphosphatase